MTTMEHADHALEDAPAAWRRPGVVFVMYAYRVVIALLIAMPFSVVLGAGVGGYPRGDAMLFDEGGMFLIETIRRSNLSMPPAAVGALCVLAVGTLAGVLPLAALIGSLGVRGRVTARDVGAFALRPVGPFALLFGAFAFVQAVLLAIVTAIGGAISRRPMFDTPGADRVKLSFAVLGIVLVLLVGVIHDLARVAVVRDELGFRASLRRAWRTFKKSHVKVLGAWAFRAALGALGIYAAVSFGSRLGVDSSAKAWAGFLAYQASIILALFLKASWFASAIRHVDDARPVVAPEPVPEAIAEVLPAEPVVADVPPITESPAENTVAPEAESAPADEVAAENSQAADNLDPHA